MAKKIMAVTVALTMGLILSAAPSYATTFKTAGPPTCCSYQ